MAEAGHHTCLRKIAPAGFTLLELLAVLVILAVLCVAAVVRYASMLDEARAKAASGLVASAQSELSLEFARRVMAGEDMNAAPGDLCNNVAIGNGEASATLLCDGTFTNRVSITANVDGVPAAGNWFSPLGGN